MIKELIKKYALLFEGIKERGNNQGWEDVFFPSLNMSFQELMETVGWKETHAWCAYFSELVWKLAYSEFDSTMVDKLDALFSANAVNTWKNFNQSDFACSKIPVNGSVVIWQMYKDGKDTIRGHAGIVIDVIDGVIETIEGNTNKKGSRDGDQVAHKTKIVNFDKKHNGLVLLGFIHPKEIS
jgi:hypothetical protein